jgi:ATP-dependent Lhr-like helicase
MARASRQQARRDGGALHRAAAPWNPKLRIWGLSATLGNIDQALDRLLAGSVGRIVKGVSDKKVEIDTLIPADVDRFPWAGHLGLTMLDDVVRAIEASRSTLVFTNVRSAAETWYQGILEAKPEWAGIIGLHHGSLDTDVRRWVEEGLKEGRLKAVVATSSLDLGVDFSPVERVLQIGSAKGVARLLQRAGRSGHAPGQSSHITCVPSHALEFVEAAAARARRSRAGSNRASRRPAARPPHAAPRHHRVRRGLRRGRDEARGDDHARLSAISPMPSGSGRSTS